MTLARRVTAIETSLSATQLVLRWLADAHAYGDIESYVASLLAEDPPVAPMDRLAREAVHGARTAMRGKRPEVVAEAVRSALRETVFRFELVIQINVTAHELLDRQALIDAALAAHLALLTSEKPRPAKDAERLARLRGALEFRVSELRAAKEARSIVEGRYLDGHGALFPDAADAWKRQVPSTEAIAEVAVRLAELDGVAAAAPPDHGAYSRRMTELVADLIEPARSAALDKLGEGERALGMATAWLRARIEPGAVGLDG